MKKLLSLSLVCILMMISFTGCFGGDGNTTLEIDYEALYEPVINKYYNLIFQAINSDYMDIELEDGEMGVYEVAMALERDAANVIGYMLMDLSGDGVPELLIGSSNNNGYSYTKNEIYAVYTIQNNAPVFVLEGRSRSFYSLMEGNSFYYYGSNGAAYSIFGEYELSFDGTEVICKDYYFTHELNDDFSEIGYFHNTSGEWDKSKAEIMDIEADEYWGIEGALAQRTIYVEFTSFSGDTQTPGEDFEEDGYVTVDFAVISDEGFYDEFVADDSDMQVAVKFTAVGTVKDFKVLGLSYAGANENGEISFDEEVLYESEIIPDGESILVKMTFFGTIPSYGITYTKDGVEKRFAVEMSGMDGSLLLTEF